MNTKKLLLDTAETLFAEKGYAETSLREITSVAGANLASVNYHFGGKEGLLSAVFERRLRPVNHERLVLLDHLEAVAGNQPLDLERILWANLAPPFRSMHEWGAAGRRFTQLIGRMHSDPSQPIESFLLQFEEVKVRFKAAFVRALPSLEAEEVERRMHFVIGAMAHTFIWGHAVCCLRTQAEPRCDDVLHSLVRFASVGMQAPAGHLELDSDGDIETLAGFPVPVPGKAS